MVTMTRFRMRSATSATAAIAVALALTLPACMRAAAPAGQTQAEVEAAIADFNRQYLAAINSGDIDALAALTTEDHMMISSGEPPMTGKQALVDAMTSAFERFDFDESWTPLETVASGDVAYQRGTFVVNATPKAGGEGVHMTGNFLRIYRRQPDGRWFMTRDNFNGDTGGGL
jgi:ketosteroid isomerase-like protein